MRADSAGKPGPESRTCGPVGGTSRVWVSNPDGLPTGFSMRVRDLGLFVTNEFSNSQSDEEKGSET
jgi:outer membrane lipoprotein-sorting protein